MEMQLTLNVDKQTFELANSFAREKGLSMNEMVEFYLKWIVWNESFDKTPSIINEIVGKNVEINQEDKWKKLENFLESNRFDLPKNYKFNREELYDR